MDPNLNCTEVLVGMVQLLQNSYVCLTPVARARLQKAAIHMLLTGQFDSAINISRSTSSALSLESERDHHKVGLDIGRAVFGIFLVGLILASAYLCYRYCKKNQRKGQHVNDAAVEMLYLRDHSSFSVSTPELSQDNTGKVTDSRASL